MIVRSFLATGITSGLYNYFVYAHTNSHLSILASEIDANDPLVSQHAGFTEYYKYILQQANLAALKEMSGTIIIFGLTVTALLTVVFAYRKIGKRLFATS